MGNKLIDTHNELANTVLKTLDEYINHRKKVVEGLQAKIQSLEAALNYDTDHYYKEKDNLQAEIDTLTSLADELADSLVKAPHHDGCAIHIMMSGGLVDAIKSPFPCDCYKSKLTKYTSWKGGKK